MKMVKLKESCLQHSIKTAAAAIGLTLLAGCSTMTGGVDSIGQGVLSFNDKLQSVTGHVQVEEIDDKSFKLTEVFYEPVTNFDSFAMRAKARESCPDGYVYESRHAKKTSELAYSHEQCVGTDACSGYTLEWHIKCEDVPYEPFTLFGKT